MGNDLIVRIGEHKDVKALARFNIAMAWETERKRLDPATVTRGVQAVIDHPEHGFYVVAADGTEVAASLMVTYEWSDWRCGLFWWIQSVYVRPETRRRGVFRRLYEFVQATASEEPNVCGIRLYVEQSNHAAQGVYAALGMQETAYHVYEAIFPERPLP
jgi:ribosomal protein S18 acetylase RimI-like enzyme